MTCDPASIRSTAVMLGPISVQGVIATTAPPASKPTSRAKQPNSEPQGRDGDGKAVAGKPTRMLTVRARLGNVIANWWSPLVQLAPLSGQLPGRRSALGA